MGFGGTAKPEEQKPAVAPAAPAAPVEEAPAGVGGELIAAIAAAIAAYDGDGESVPVIGRLYSPGWTSYSRVATVTTRDAMF